MNIRRAAYLSAGASYTALIAQFVAIVIVTRFLSPVEMGGYAVSIALFNVLRPLSDFSLSRYEIQAHSVERNDLRAVVTVGWIMGALVWALIWFPADAIARFFGATDIAPTLRIMSGTLVLYPFVLIGGAVLAREMRQERLALVNALNPIVQSVTSVALVMNGYGVVSLGVGYLAGFMCEFVLLLVFTGRMALVQPGLRGIGDVLRFGVFMTRTSVAAQIGNGVPDTLIGRLLGLAQAGIYSRSVALVGMMRRGLDAITAAVALPGFSRMLRDGDDPRNAYLGAIALSTGVMWPFLAMLFVLADPLVAVLYGERWHEAAPISRYVAIMSLGIPVTGLATPLLSTLRREATLLRVELLVQAVKVTVVLFASMWSLEVVMAGLIATSAFQLVIMLFVLHRSIALDVREIYSSISKSFWIAIITGAGCLAGSLVSVHGNWAQLAVGAMCGGVAWLVAVAASKHALREELVKTLGWLFPPLGQMLTARISETYGKVEDRG